MLGLLTAAILACSPPDGTTGLLDRPERVIVVGEMHGTAEVPAAFAQMVCAASERGPVVVALEMGEAMFDMLESVRQLKASGRDIGFHVFQPTSRSTPPRLGQSWSELAMAQNIAQAVYDRPEARIMVLVGGFHARKTIYPRWIEIGLPAAAHLPASETLTIKVAQQGGTHWGCSTENCGVQPSMTSEDPGPRGIFLNRTDNGAYDGVLSLGPWTASPPIGGD